MWQVHIEGERGERAWWSWKGTPFAYADPTAMMYTGKRCVIHRSKRSVLHEVASTVGKQKQVEQTRSWSVRTSLQAAPSGGGSVFFGLRAKNVDGSEIVRNRLIREWVLVAAQKMIADGSLFVHVSSLSDDRILHHSCLLYTSPSPRD